MRKRVASFDEFVTGYTPDLMNTAYLICCDDADAEDLVQECLMRIAKRWPRVREMDSPAAYARRIVANLAIDGRRNQVRREDELARLHQPEPDNSVIEFGLTDHRAEAALEAITARAPLLDALARLSPQQRAVIVLRYFHDLSEAETASVLGCGVGTVKSSTARGLSRLRTIVEPQRSGNEADASQIQSGRTEP